MREDLLRELETEYEQQRLLNERTEAARRKEISEQCPEIAELMIRRENLIHAALRNALQHQGDAGQLPEQMRILSGQIRRALADRNYPENYLEPVARCTRCGDSGYTGQLIREPCECLKQAYQRKLRSRIGLDERGTETFSNFRTDCFSDEKIQGRPYSEREWMIMVRNTCETWADQYPDTKYQMLLLTGASGLGKTFLLRTMTSRLIERGVPVLLISAGAFLDAARSAVFEQENDMLNELMSVRVLMLDDLGTEPLMNNMTVEQLFRLVDHRQTRGLATVVSTNLTLDELKKRYTERIASRLIYPRSSCVMRLVGKDHRGQWRTEINQA